MNLECLLFLQGQFYQQLLLLQAICDRFEVDVGSLQHSVKQLRKIRDIILPLTAKDVLTIQEVVALYASYHFQNICKLITHFNPFLVFLVRLESHKSGIKMRSNHLGVRFEFVGNSCYSAIVKYGILASCNEDSASYFYNIHLASF